MGRRRSARCEMQAPPWHWFVERRHLRWGVARTGPTQRDVRKVLEGSGATRCAACGSRKECGSTGADDKPGAGSSLKSGSRLEPEELGPSKAGKSRSSAAGRASHDTFTNLTVTGPGSCPEIDRERLRRSRPDCSVSQFVLLEIVIDPREMHR